MLSRLTANQAKSVFPEVFSDSVCWFWPQMSTGTLSQNPHFRAFPWALETCDLTLRKTAGKRCTEIYSYRYVTCRPTSQRQI
jgi:hypothetical protein